jgi:hypothetical protein
MGRRLPPKPDAGGAAMTRRETQFFQKVIDFKGIIYYNSLSYENNPVVKIAGAALETRIGFSPEAFQNGLECTSSRT